MTPSLLTRHVASGLASWVVEARRERALNRFDLGGPVSSSPMHRFRHVTTDVPAIGQ